MQTSTTPVREALRELAAEGLLHLDPHRGVLVHEPTDVELQEIYEIRGVLEPLSIRKTIKHISAEELETARRVHDQACAIDDPGEWALANRDFHAVLAEASRSPELSSILTNLRNRSTLYVAISLEGSPDHIAASNEQHHELLVACEDADEERAVEVVRRHLGQTVRLGHRQLERDTEEP